MIDKGGDKPGEACGVEGGEERPVPRTALVTDGDDGGDAGEEHLGFLR